MSGSSTPRWVVVAGVAIALLTGAVVAAWSVELPYFAFSAGPVGDAIGAVSVEPDVASYPPKGELFMLTVAVQGVNLYEAVAAGLDPAVDLVAQERVRPPDISDQEFRERGLNQMDQAKENAIAVALEHLGEGSLIRSDGVEVVDLLRDDLSPGTIEVGDIITEVDGVRVVIADDIRAALEGLSPGDEVELTIRRGEDELRVTLPLFESEDAPGRPLIGILAGTANPRYPVEIDSENIGGPSAGMMYSLAIIDLLSPGDLTHGHVVAGTGTIAGDGTVGAIGGVRQKVVAAEAAGAEIMLVPAANYEDALTAPRTSMELVSVANIDDALTYLAELAPAT